MRPKKTILCVDDNEQALSVRKFLLETRGGYRVHEARSGQEAISVFTSTQIDLVLTDLGLPQMDGNALIGHLKELSPDIPMILTSESVRAGDRAHRADLFLSKGSYSPADLLEKIRVMSARKRGPKKQVQSVLPPPSQAQVLPEMLTAKAS